MATAISASVTVSMGELVTGQDSRMLRVSEVDKSTCKGKGPPQDRLCLL